MDVFLSVVLVVMGWMFITWSGFNLGIKHERHKQSQENTFQIPQEDAQYWRDMYEELAQAYDMREDNERGKTSK